MNGKDLTSALQLKLSNLRVLYISAYTDDIRVDTGRGQLLRKPFSPDDLAKKVEEILNMNNHSLSQVRSRGLARDSSRTACP
jgi:DNA-binding response OmpR family regulator